MRTKTKAGDIVRRVLRFYFLIATVLSSVQFGVYVMLVFLGSMDFSSLPNNFVWIGLFFITFNGSMVFLLDRVRVPRQIS